MRKLTEEQVTEIKAMWIAGVLSHAEIARRFDVGEGAIRNLAKRRGWPERGKGRTAAEIAQDKAALLPVRIPADVDAAIDQLSDVGADIIGSHRKDLAMLRMLVMDHARDAQYAQKQRSVVEQDVMQYFVTKMQLDPVQAAAYERQLNMALSTLSLGNRAKTLQALVQSYERLTEMERKNWKLDVEEDGRETYEKLLKEIHDKVYGEGNARSVEQDLKRDGEQLSST